jgi:prepilin-type processing-associated H-X9-DG protein
VRRRQRQGQPGLPVPARGLKGGQFASLHGAVTNVAFADASVRPLSAAVSPKVLDALATVAGGEEVGVPGD